MFFLKATETDLVNLSRVDHIRLEDDTHRFLSEGITVFEHQLKSSSEANKKFKGLVDLLYRLQPQPSED